MIKRGTFAYFGTAVSPAQNEEEIFISWATVGQTIGGNPFEELGDTWFQHGRTEQEALDNLHDELRGIINLH